MITCLAVVMLEMSILNEGRIDRVDEENSSDDEEESSDDDEEEDEDSNDDADSNYEDYTIRKKQKGDRV